MGATDLLPEDLLDLATSRASGDDNGVGVGVEKPQRDVGGGEGLTRGVTGGDVDLWEIPDNVDDLPLLRPERGAKDTRAREDRIGLNLGREETLVVECEEGDTPILRCQIYSWRERWSRCLSVIRAQLTGSPKVGPPERLGWGIPLTHGRTTTMKKSRFTEEQIVHALRQAEMGTPAVEVCRKLGVTEQTFYRWKRKFAGMGVVELRRLRQVEEENRKLKQLVADLSLDKHMLQEALRKNW